MEGYAATAFGPFDGLTFPVAEALVLVDNGGPF